MFIGPSSDFAVPSEALDFGLEWVAWITWAGIWRFSWVLGKRGTESFISESYLSSHLVPGSDAGREPELLYLPKSLFVKACISAAQMLLLILNWVVVQGVCELLHKVQWSLSKAQVSFLQANICYGYARMQIDFFPCFFPRRQIEGMSLVFPQTMG